MTVLRGYLTTLAIAAFALPAAAQAPPPLDLLLVNGRVLDGAGNPWVRQDVGIRGERISYVGLATVDRPAARDTVDVAGLVITPGFIDMHSHADLASDYGRSALAFLYQGITTAVLGIDAVPSVIAAFMPKASASERAISAPTTYPKSRQNR